MIESISGRYIVVSGHRIYFETAGDPKNQAIVLIHTAGQHGIQWRFVLEKMVEKNYYAIAPDLPGHGKSLVKDFKPINNIHHFSEIIFQLSKKLELKNPIFVGCSIGGDIVLDIAAYHSNSIRGIVSCEGALRTPTIAKHIIEQGLEDSGVPSYGDHGFLSGLSLCGTKADSERVKEIAFTRRSGDPKIYYNDLYAWINHDITEKVENITCPVLIVYGNEDYILPFEYVEETKKYIKQAEILILDGIGHYPGTEFIYFDDIIDKFIKSLDK